jgi:glucose-6-phosphate 1-epimerase
MSVQELNAVFAVSGRVRFTESENRLIFIEVDNTAASAKISLYGGQVLSYRPSDQQEDLLFLSAHSSFQETKAIRGGIPLCWPWFGKNEKRPDLPNHGVARISWWTVVGIETLADDLTKIVLQRATGGADDFASIELQLHITIGRSLKLELITVNHGIEPFSFTQALHHYFKVGDISAVKIAGLDRISYLDKLDNNSEKSQPGLLEISQAVDRIYEGWHNDLILLDRKLERSTNIIPKNAEHIIVWNPWTKAMADLEDNDYRRFVCIEAGNVLAPVNLASGETFNLTCEILTG